MKTFETNTAIAALLCDILKEICLSRSNSVPVFDWSVMEGGLKSLVVDDVGLAAKFVIDSELAIPEAFHERWRKHYENTGWVSGRYFSLQRKVSPHLADFNSCTQLHKIYIRLLLLLVR